MPPGAFLVDTPAAPIPAGGQAEWFEGVGGARLRAALFAATAGSARGSVVVNPGRTEPIEKYFETVGRLRTRGFAVLVHDWRGQGLSHRLLGDRRLGHAEGHADFLGDHARLLGAFEGRLPRPWIAMGHSMGGCLTLLALAEGEQRLDGAILSAPMLGLSLGGMPLAAARSLTAFQRAAGRGGFPARRAADIAAPEPFAGNILTHDPVRYARNVAQVVACPDLALGGPTWGWLDFALVATARLRRGAGATRIATPLVVVAAGEDRLVDNAATRRVAARVPGAALIEIPGAYHEILQETDALQAPFWSAFDRLAGRIA